MTKATRHIALVAPGGRITPELAEKAGAIAAEHCGAAARLHFHPQCFLEAGHFAGSDDERAAAFLEVANDPQFDAVWFARGGYGAVRIEDDTYSQLNEHAGTKTYFGYSDNGVILARLHGLGIGQCVHGPIPIDLTWKNGEAAIRRALDYLVFEKSNGIELGLKTQPALAFNITVLAHMIGQDWMPDFAGCQILLEDIGEYLYRIDRAMAAILLNPRMENAAGVRLGRISDAPENDRPFGATAEEIAQYWCARAGVPYLGRADIGHDADNKIVPFGKPSIA